MKGSPMPDPIKIETDIPLPLVTRRGTRYPFAEMKIGESFFLSCASKHEALKAQATVGHCARYALGRNKIVTRTVEGGIRVWRIE